MEKFQTYINIFKVKENNRINACVSLASFNTLIRGQPWLTPPTTLDYSETLIQIELIIGNLLAHLSCLDQEGALLWMN